MAGISDLVKGNCLVWDTERPYRDVPRKSSNFSLLGCEWNFQMACDCRIELYFNIYLHKVTDRKPLERDLTISTFVSSEDRSDWPCSITTGRKAVRKIWLYPEEKNMRTLLDKACRWTHYRKLRIIFYIDAPFTQVEIETHRNPPGTDTAYTLTSAPDSTNFSRAISSEDKCVQVTTLDILPDLESLSHDFCQLLENKSFPDVELRCGDRSIRAHRSILASRSDVFATMLRNKMTENKKGTVDVKDMDAEVLDLLLNYVYSGKIPELSEDTASSLYAAGDTYSIHALKKTCSDWIVAGLTEKNCLGFLILADTHSDEGFKDRVASFVAENLEALEKQTWSEFRKNHSGLAVSVYERRLESTLSKQA